MAVAAAKNILQMSKVPKVFYVHYIKYYKSFHGYCAW